MSGGPGNPNGNPKAWRGLGADSRQTGNANLAIPTPVSVPNGGTGQTAYTNGQLLIGDTGTGGLDKATLTAGTGIAVTNGAGAITIASTVTGTVTNVSSANGDLTVASPTTTPVLTVNSAPKLDTGRTLSITGDLAYTSPSFDGSANVTGAGTLATVNSNVGTFGDSSHVAQITVNAKGLVTAASNVAVAGGGTVTSVSSANGDLTVSSPTTTPVLTVNSAPKWDTARTLSFTGDAAGSGSVDGSANVATGLTLAASGVSAATYGDSTHVGQFTVDAKGRITSASNVAISGGGSGTVTSFTATSPVSVSPDPITSTGTISLVAGALPNGMTATTQAASDNSTKVATDAFVTTAINNAIAGVNPAVAVQAATAAVLPNTPTYNNGVSGVGATLTAAVTNTALVVDGYTPLLLDRILVKNQASAFQNGVYYVSQLAALGLAWVLTRALDYDQPSDINNTGAIPVVNGTANASTQWVLTSSVTTIGTDSLTYTQFTVAPSNVLQTGGTNPTNHGVVVGAGTNVVGSTAAGTAGQVLTSNGASADPSYQSASAGITKSRVYLTNAFTTSGGSGGAWQKIPINNVDFDTGSIWNVANKRFIPTVAGYYMCLGRVRMNTGSVSGMVLGIGLNGSQTQGIGGDSVSNSAVFAVGGSGLIHCNGSTDYLELWWFGSGGLVATTGSFDTWMVVMGPF